MANVAHSTLTGAELHEPKGVATAAAGTVYVSNGAGSGTWSSIGTSAFTGTILDTAWPVVQDGFLELDGTDINTTTYSALYTVMTIQQTGTRSNGSPVITSLSSTTHMRVGYYVFGTGIASGTTILSIDSATQITLSGNASSSGSSTVVVSPWLLNTNTIRLPNTSAAARYRRSRSSSMHVGVSQADQNQAHTHTGTTGTESADHTHSGTTGVEGASHTHLYQRAIQGAEAAFGATSDQFMHNGFEFVPTESQSNNHTHAFTTGGRSAAHTHSFTTASSGSTEARPISLVVMTVVKT